MIRINFLLLLSASLGAFGDIALYRWARSGTSYTHMIAGLLIWICSLVVWALALRWSEKGLGVSFVLTAAFHILVVLIYDRIIERSVLSRLESIGMGLAILGIILIEFGQVQKEQTAPADKSNDAVHQAIE